MRGNVAGRLASAFLESKLTPLLIAAALGVGAWAVATMPSEEEPQIIVPLADLYLPVPGATPREVENRVLVPLESVLSGIEGVEYVYTHAEPGFGLATVRYEVGRDMEQSLVQLYSTLMKHADLMPPGLQFPLVKTVTIDDVPFFTASLYPSGADGEGSAPMQGGGYPDAYDPAMLRRLAEEVRAELEQVPEVREVTITGGYPREVRVELLPERMAAYGVDPGFVAQRLGAANVRLQAGEYVREDEVVRVTAGPFLTDAEDVRSVVLDVRDGRLITVGDVARVVDGPSEVDTYAFHTEAPGQWAPLATVAVSKRPGADATALGRNLEARLHSLEGRLVPEAVTVHVTRNYGETAREKVTTLQEHLFLAILAVGLLVWVTMGWRSALAVMVAVPITFALTLFVYQVFGYTLNRVTLFALIFVTGIVIDDSIIVAENMERHFAMRDRPLKAAARAAVDEVGNPTILATLTVIAAVLPMLFVSGLMGPYMSPMPIGATVAMIFSLAVALVITPWLSYHLLKNVTHGEDEAYVLENTKIYRAYRRIMMPLLDHPRRMGAALAGVTLLLVGAVAMFFTRAVTVKMLPFDDKNEMQVIVDMPEGTPLETTTAVAQDLARAVVAEPEVEDVQLYGGVAAPFNFNGMIRHYYLRRGAHVADLQVNLVDKGARSAESHDIALRVRPVLDSIARASGTGANVKVVEVPPGPPVLSTLVAEVYGPDPEEQARVASEVRNVFDGHPSVVDVDWSLTSPQREMHFQVDADRAALAGVDKARVVAALRAGLAGQTVTHLSDPDARNPVPVNVRLAEPARSGSDRLAGLHVVSATGQLVPVSELVDVVEEPAPQVVDRKNGQRVVYVTADVAGGAESPVYAILDMKEELAQIPLASGATLGALYTRQPGLVEQPVMKWDGEWQITYEVFRDLGIAFAGALLLIYALIVAWFGSFWTPLVMMVSIPLTLVGIAPGHWIFGSFFTATSMIGMIALAGIMVRNGILLIDYLEARLEQGVPLKQAVIEAGAVRTRPIAITAAAVILGAFVILFDPIFQGLAVALITGGIASTVLSLVVAPGVYFLIRRRKGGGEGTGEPARGGRGEAVRGPTSRMAEAPTAGDGRPVAAPEPAEAGSGSTL